MIYDKTTNNDLEKDLIIINQELKGRLK